MSICSHLGYVRVVGHSCRIVSRYVLPDTFLVVDILNSDFWFIVLSVFLAGHWFAEGWTTASLHGGFLFQRYSSGWPLRVLCRLLYLTVMLLCTYMQMLLERGYDSCPQVGDVRTEVMDMLGEDDSGHGLVDSPHRNGGHALGPVSFKRMVASGQASTVSWIILYRLPFS